MPPIFLLRKPLFDPRRILESLGPKFSCHTKQTPWFHAKYQFKSKSSDAIDICLLKSCLLARRILATKTEMSWFLKFESFKACLSIDSSQRFFSIFYAALSLFITKKALHCGWLNRCALDTISIYNSISKEIEAGTVRLFLDKFHT